MAKKHDPEELYLKENIGGAAELEDALKPNKAIPSLRTPTQSTEEEGLVLPYDDELEVTDQDTRTLRADLLSHIEANYLNHPHGSVQLAHLSSALKSILSSLTPVGGDQRIDIADTAAAAAQSAADDAQTDATQAISDAAGAQGTADGKVTTFYTGSAPTAEGTGDLWIDTDDDRLYRWSGSAWVEIQDEDIAQAISDAATAQSTADGKIVTFYQDAPPTADGTGDFWVDTNDGNKLYRWSGSAWQSVQDASIATAQSTADGKVSFDQAVTDGWNTGDGTTTPTVPTISVCKARMSTIILQWDRQSNLTNFSHYELQCQESGDGDWYAVAQDGSGKGTIDTTTTVVENFFIHQDIPYNGTADAPTAATYVYRVKRVTKVPASSSYSGTASAAIAPVAQGDVGAGTITVAKLVADIIDTLVLDIHGFLEITSADGFVAGKYASPEDGDERIFMDVDEMVFQRHNGSVWVDRVRIGNVDGQSDDFKSLFEERITIKGHDGAVSSGTPDATAMLVLDTSDYATIAILSATTGFGAIYFGDSSEDRMGIITYDHSTDLLSLGAGGVSVFSIADSYIKNSRQVRVIDGTVSNLGLSFIGKTDMGFYQYSTNSLGMVVSGALIAYLTTSSLRMAADIDVRGTSSSDVTGFRNIYAGGTTYYLASNGRCKVAYGAGAPTGPADGVYAVKGSGTYIKCYAAANWRGPSVISSGW